MSQQITKNSYFSTGDESACCEINVYEDTKDNYNISVNNNMNIGTPDEVLVMYTRLFSGIEMVELNRFLYQTLNELQNKGKEGSSTVIKFVKENAVFDLHPSLMQTTLLMTQNIDGIGTERERILIRLKEKLQA